MFSFVRIKFLLVVLGIFPYPFAICKCITLVGSFDFLNYILLTGTGR